MHAFVEYRAIFDGIVGKLWKFPPGARRGGRWRASAQRQSASVAHTALRNTRASSNWCGNVHVNSMRACGRLNEHWRLIIAQMLARTHWFVLPLSTHSVSPRTLASAHPREVQTGECQGADSVVACSRPGRQARTFGRPRAARSPLVASLSALPQNGPDQHFAR